MVLQVEGPHLGLEVVWDTTLKYNASTEMTLFIALTWIVIHDFHSHTVQAPPHFSTYNSDFAATCPAKPQRTPGKAISHRSYVQALNLGRSLYIHRLSWI